jgi:hypothetical protein
MPNGTALRGARAVLASCLVAFGFGCGPGEGEGEGAGTPAFREPRAAPSERPSAGQAGAMPEAGRAHVELSGGLVTVRSNAAPRVAVVLELARAASFDLEIVEIAPDTLTLRIEDAELERVLPVLLDTIPYRVDYDFDAGLGRHVIARLRIGAGGPDGVAEVRSERFREPPPERREARGETRSPARRGEIERDLRARLMLPEDLPAEVASELQSSNALTRSEAIAEVDPDGLGREVLLDYLALDPDPRVRAAAAEQLSMTDSFRGVQGLLEALDDPDPRVVLQAVEALDLLGDESLIPELRALRNHGDPAVRQAAEEALESLE